MTAILGLSAYYHDSAAALLIDGRVIAAAQEERFSRVKHDARFPERAVTYCLAEAGIRAADLDQVVFYEKPFRKFERLLESYLASAPRGLASFRAAIPAWLREKLRQGDAIRAGVGAGYRKRLAFVEHHEAHAASAFFPSPFEEAAVLTVDGVGEWATATVGRGAGPRLELEAELRFPHSLGLLYSAFTYFCGFRVNSGEYKLMGLAPFGEPRYEGLIREKLMDLKADGSFRLDLSYFDYVAGLRMTSAGFARLFGGPPRRPESPIGARECDLAASIQKVTEEVMLRMAREAHRRTGSPNLCLAGGVALNCVANGRVLREGPFENIWVQPAAGDAGGALGAAWFAWHQLLERPRAAGQGSGRTDAQQGSLLGPRFTGEEVESALSAAGGVFRRFGDEGALCAEAARLIAEGKVVGWFQGRMEFGPRALGGRSILGDPRRADMQQIMNVKIKLRESFRPFAPAVLREATADWFDLPAGAESPYMLLVAGVRTFAPPASRPSPDGRADLARIRAIRSAIPAVTHLDGSARVQTVDADRSPRFHRLLEAFATRTGCPVLINTSFNIRGEPIVCAPADAYRCFMATHIDVLVVEHCLLPKEAQPDSPRPDLEAYLGKFGND